LISSTVGVKSFERSATATTAALTILVSSATASAFPVVIATIAAVGSWLFALTIKFFEEVVLADFIKVHAQLSAGHQLNIF